MRHNRKLCDNCKPRHYIQWSIPCEICDGWARDPNYQSPLKEDIKYKGGWIRQGLIQVPTHKHRNNS